MFQRPKGPGLLHGKCSNGTTMGLKVSKLCKFHWTWYVTILEYSVAMKTAKYCCLVATEAMEVNNGKQ